MRAFRWHRCQVGAPTMAPISPVDSVPDTSRFETEGDHVVAALRRYGGEASTMMPRLPELARPHIA